MTLLMVLLCVLFINASAADDTGPRENTEDTHTVYVIQVYYHTGLIIEMDRDTRKMLTFENYFKGYRYVDIGWGDEVYYQDPNYTFSKAARAILVPTSSVVRVEGFNQNIKDTLAWSDRSIKIILAGPDFKGLCEFVNSSFTKNKKGELIVDSTRDKGSVVFFKSPYRYYLFNTCNTWIARAFKHAGRDVSPACLVTARGLFRRLRKKILKTHRLKGKLR